MKVLARGLNFMGNKFSLKKILSFNLTNILNRIVGY